MARSRYPSLQVPVGATGDLRSFCEAVKERLEITTGDRGDPRDRLLTVRDVEAAGMATVTVRNKFATLSGGASAQSVAALMSDSEATGTFAGVLVPSLEILQADVVVDALDFIAYNNAAARLQRVPYQALRELFLTADSDAEIQGNWQFQNEEIGLEINAEVPRLRYTESSSTEVLPTDGTVWDWTVDDQLMSLLLVSDDEATTAAMLELGRDGLDPSFFALVNGTILQVQDGTLAEPGLTWDDDIDTGLYRISANRFGLSAGGVLALDVQGTQLGVPTGSAGAPGLAFQGDTDTGPFRAAANEYAISAGGTERLRVNATGIQVAGTAVLTAVTGHVDVTPSAAADFAALKVRNNAGTEIWRLNSEVDGDLDFARQSGTGLLKLNGVEVVSVSATQTLTSKTIDTASNDITVDQADVTGLVAALAAKLDSASYTAADVLAKLLTVDGAGSGIDADLLDGSQGSAYALRANNQTISGNWDFTTRQYFGVTAANAALVSGLLDGGTAVLINQEIRNHRVGAEPFWATGRINGSYAAPTAILNGQSLGEFIFGGFDGTSFQAASMRMFYSATEDWSATTRGGQLTIQTTTTGATTKATVFTAASNSTGAYARFPSGVASQPGIAFGSDADCGLYLSATNEVSLATGGSQRLQINATAVQAAVPLRAADGSLGSPSIAFGTWPTTGLHLSGTNEITLGTANARRTVWDSGGRVLLGGLTTSVQVGTLAGLTLQVGSTGNCGLSIARFSNDTNAPVFVMGKSRDTVLGGAAAVQSGDNISRWQFCGADGTDLQTLAAGVYVTVAGAVSSNVVPGQMEFYTANTAGAFVEAMRLTTGGTALFRSGTAALPSISMLSDPDTGVFGIAANQLGLTAGGTLVLDLSTALVAITATTIRLNTTTATTVGAAGAAAALPAAPLGYITANVGGTAVKIPYYNV